MDSPRSCLRAGGAKPRRKEHFMKTYHKKRMRKLIAFLYALRPEQFNFTRVVSDVKRNGVACGTVCCAIGWTPAVFPKLVKWNQITLIESGRAGAFGLDTARGVDQHFSLVAQDLFGISDDITDDLFAPSMQHRVHESLPSCRLGATPKQVAAMLEKFLALVESGEVRP